MTNFSRQPAGNSMHAGFRPNNLDLIRLLAALQVALVHSLEHLDVADQVRPLMDVLRLFPGVPIFFLISGFLISHAYERNQHLGQYCRNRVFRIFPALIACMALALCSVALSGYFSGKQINGAHLSAWFIGQITFFQFYNPEFMRAFGTGVLNGSLWTITVELQFYVLIPVLYSCLNRFGRSQRQFALLVLIGAFCAFHGVYHSYVDSCGDLLWYKLIGVSFMPWLYMFLIGVLFQWNFETAYRWLNGKALFIVAGYSVVATCAIVFWNWTSGNHLHPAVFLLLAATIFAVAYTAPTTSEQVLQGNDISYGIYLYHAPVLNILMYFEYTGRLEFVAWTIAITALLAILSWVVVEQPCLRRKRTEPRTASPLLTATSASQSTM